MLDYLLAACLILVLPALALWRSWHPRTDRPVSRLKNYIVSIAVSATLLLILALDWASSGRSLAALGLDLPLTRTNAIELLLAVALLVALCVLIRVQARKRGSASTAAAQPGNDTLSPHNARELACFLLLALLLGGGWEVLYRGFLLWLLTPWVGTVGAVCIAALAYALAHGFKTRKLLLGATVSAFAFTIAYALSHSLWWLMLLHVSIAAVVGWSRYRKFAAQPELQSGLQADA